MPTRISAGVSPSGLPSIPAWHSHASDDYFESLSCQDTAVELSGQLKTVAVSVMKIANDLRWMNSGPAGGARRARACRRLQPGSSIMPGKVNPVIPEAAAMVAAQVIGNDVTITDRWPVRQLPAECHVASDRSQPFGKHPAACRGVARQLADRAVQRFYGERGADARSPRAKSRSWSRRSIR
jgi:fumarate hydratase, class II